MTAMEAKDVLITLAPMCLFSPDPARVIMCDYEGVKFERAVSAFCTVNVNRAHDLVHLEVNIFSVWCLLTCNGSPEVGADGDDLFLERDAVFFVELFLDDPFDDFFLGHQIFVDGSGCC
jgi:hypothetical protein